MNIDKRIDIIDCESIEGGLYKTIEYLDSLREYAKKIGNDQRLFFYRFFRNLFDSQGSVYCKVDAAADKAFKDYLRETR